MARPSKLTPEERIKRHAEQEERARRRKADYARVRALDERNVLRPMLTKEQANSLVESVKRQYKGAPAADPIVVDYEIMAVEPFHPQKDTDEQPGANVADSPEPDPNSGS